MALRRPILFLLITLLGGPVFARSLETRGVHQAEPSVTRAPTNVTSGEGLMFAFERATRHKKLFRLDKPYRVVLDVPNMDPKTVHVPQTRLGGLVKAIRVGRFDAQTVRIVIELQGPVADATAGEPDAHHIGVTLTPVAGYDYASGKGTVPVPVILKKAGGKSAPVKAPPKPAAKPGPKLPLVVIDAGHGGKDPGAHGTHSTIEKNVTLRYAKTLREVLQTTGRYRVMLTRDDDRFILLGERVRISEKAGANAFISLHADSTPMMQTARGLSVYTVSENASDATAAELAEKENSVDIMAGFKVDVDDQEAASILLELAQRETKNKASELADQLVRGIEKSGIHTLPGAHRFAGFRVLKAPDVPSVLIETGFLSNDEDERQLNSDAYPRKLAGSIVTGLDGYFAKHPVK